MKLKILAFILTIPSLIFAQAIHTPLEKNNFTRPTNYDELSNFLNDLDQSSDLLKVEILAKSVEDRNLYMMKFSNSEYGKDKSKVINLASPNRVSF